MDRRESKSLFVGLDVFLKTVSICIVKRRGGPTDPKIKSTMARLIQVLGTARGSDGGVQEDGEGA